MLLLTKKNRQDLPGLYETENIPNPLVRVKLFTPWSSWTWYLIEYDPETNIAFGYAHDATNPWAAELGYIDLNELSAIRGPFGLTIERDRYFRPTPLQEIKEWVQWERKEKQNDSR